MLFQNWFFDVKQVQDTVELLREIRGSEDVKSGTGALLQRKRPPWAEMDLNAKL